MKTKLIFCALLLMGMPFLFGGTRNINHSTQFRPTQRQTERRNFNRPSNFNCVPQNNFKFNRYNGNNWCPNPYIPNCVPPVYLYPTYCPPTITYQPSYDPVGTISNTTPETQTYNQIDNSIVVNPDMCQAMIGMSIRQIANTLSKEPEIISPDRNIALWEYNGKSIFVRLSNNKAISVSLSGTIVAVAPQATYNIPSTQPSFPIFVPNLLNFQK